MLSLSNQCFPKIYIHLTDTIYIYAITFEYRVQKRESIIFPNFVNIIKIILLIFIKLSIFPDTCKKYY